jgi:hypothetical protein
LDTQIKELNSEKETARARGVLVLVEVAATLLVMAAAFIVVVVVIGLCNHAPENHHRMRIG